MEKTSWKSNSIQMIICPCQQWQKSVFEEDGKIYPQTYLDECLYEL